MSLYQRLRAGSLLLPLLFCCTLLWACGTGPNGGGGINSAPGITDRFSAVTIHPLGLATATASCQTGEQMLSGGWAVTTPAYQDKVTRGGITHTVTDEYFIAASYPSSANSWTVTFTNQAIGSGDVLGTAHVECLTKGSAPTIVSQSGNTNSGNTLTVNCPQNMHLTGGGYQLTNVSQSNIASAVIDFEASTPIGLTQWMVATDYSIGSLNLFGNNVSVYAVCTSNLTVSAGNTATISVPAAQQPEVATSASGSGTCASGLTPVGAGYQKVKASARAFPITLFYPSYSTNTPTWATTVYSLPPITIDSPPISSGGTLKVLPLCVAVS